MSRLIDADELKKQLEHGVWNDILKEIDDTPTAYDVDKVVEQIENHKTYIFQGNDVVGERNGITKEEAIAIVKAGGIND